MRGPTNLWEACPRPALLSERKKTWPPYERPGLPVRDLASLGVACLLLWGPDSLWHAWPSFERPNIPVRGPASLWEAWPLCERTGVPVRGLVFLWEVWPPFERSKNNKMPFCGENRLQWFFCRTIVFTHISKAGLDQEIAFWGHPTSYDSLLPSKPARRLPSILARRLFSIFLCGETGWFFSLIPVAWFIFVDVSVIFWGKLQGRILWQNFLFNILGEQTGIICWNAHMFKNHISTFHHFCSYLWSWLHKISTRTTLKTHE